MRLKVLNLSFVIILFSILACEKEITSPGHGGFGSQLLSLGLFDWDVNKIKVLSGSEGIILKGVVRGGGLKFARIVMTDTISNAILYENIRTSFVASHFDILDTVYIPNIVDTIFAKIKIEGVDENEINVKQYKLKITK